MFPTVAAPLFTAYNDSIFIKDFPHVFPSNQCHAIVGSGEWLLFRENVVADSRNFDILQWWEGMSARLPLIYKCVRRTLSVPHTSCNVERTFSFWKRVRSNKHNMQEGTHKAYVSFCFNGTVPAPRVNCVAIVGSVCCIVAGGSILFHFPHCSPFPPISLHFPRGLPHFPPFSPKLPFFPFSKPLQLVSQLGCG